MPVVAAYAAMNQTVQASSPLIISGDGPQIVNYGELTLESGSSVRFSSNVNAKMTVQSLISEAGGGAIQVGKNARIVLTAQTITGSIRLDVRGSLTLYYNADGTECYS